GLRNRAKQSHERALSRARDDAQALNNSGYSLYISGDYKGAVKLLKRAAQLSPNDQRILNNLALAQCRLGKYDDAFKNFVRAGGEFTGRLNTAAILERGGQDAEAIKHYEAARLLQPTSTAVLRRLAELYQRTGKSEEAAAARRALTSAPAADTAATNGGN
ncbi:MAG: tetratricopeptide repeat protein, partial [Acidobacteriota bacterium]|nr:tetratricopeptide repeat protein [Acidobacteriota bacterium]